MGSTFHPARGMVDGQISSSPNPHQRCFSLQQEGDESETHSQEKGREQEAMEFSALNPFLPRLQIITGERGGKTEDPKEQVSAGKQFADMDSQQL